MAEGNAGLAETRFHTRRRVRNAREGESVTSGVARPPFVAREDALALTKPQSQGRTRKRRPAAAEAGNTSDVRLFSSRSYSGVMESYYDRPKNRVFTRWIELRGSREKKTRRPVVTVPAEVVPGARRLISRRMNDQIDY